MRSGHFRGHFPRARPLPPAGEAFEAITGLAPAAIWPGRRLDVVAGLELEPVGAAVEDALALGLRPNALTSRMFTFARADGTAWRAPDASFADYLGQDEIQVVLYRSTDPANAINNVLGKRDATAPNAGYELMIPGSGTIMHARLDAGATNYDSITVEGYDDGQWHVLAFAPDSSGPRWQLAGEQGAAPAAGLPASASSGARWSIGTNRLATCGMEVALVARVVGAQVQGADLLALAQALHAALVEDLGVGAELLLDPGYAIYTDPLGDPYYALP